nr:hypothetical protein [Gammaproteobacteria bacterium]
AFLGFMLAAALVFNLRYKPIGEAGYLDTWTGQLRSTERVEAPAQPAEVVRGITRVEPGSAVPFERLRRERPGSECVGVRFAFPAPEPRVRH